MIRPTKYLNLQQCALNVAALVIREVRRLRSASLVDLDSLVRHRLGDAAMANFQEAVSTLYLLGVIEYEDSEDALLWLGSHRSRDS